MDLIKDLVSKLGVSEEQAKGGAGLIFGLAKEKLSDGDFSALASKIPGLDSIMGSDKEEEKKEEGGLMGAIGDMFGDKEEEKKEEGGLMGAIGDMFGGEKEEEKKEEGGLMGAIGDMFGGDDKEEEKDDGGLLGGLTDMISGDAAGGILDSLGLEKLGSIAKLSSGFSKLGLDTGMITKFVPVVMDFAKTNGGSVVTDLLAKVLK